MKTADVSVARGFDPAALAALFVLTLRQHLRGKRPLILALLFLLPTALAVVARLTPHKPPPGWVENLIVFYLIPHTLVTLTALLYSAGIVQDEVEEQTLTYLLMRPLPRWALYLTRLAATLLVTVGLTTVFTVLAMAAIHWGEPGLWSDILPGRALKLAGLLALAQVGYCTLFGVVGMLTRWSLIAGLVYIVALEGLMASFESLMQRLTVMYYFRVLAVRWLKPLQNAGWEMNFANMPSNRTCVLVLLGASAAFALLGAVLTARREFRVKTPEGN